MKKILSILAIAAFAATSLFAQDMESATGLYNEGATALNSGDKATALKCFEEALSQAQTLGAEAEELMNNCKKNIPTIILAIGKDQIGANQNDEAIKTLTKAIEKCKEYGQADTQAEAESLIPMIYMQQGNLLLNQKNFKGAVDKYNKVVELNPTDGAAYLRLGQATMRTGDMNGAMAAFEKAKQNGQAKAADEQLSKLYLNIANNFLKQKNFKEALANAEKSISIKASPVSYNIAGTAAVALKDYPAAIKNFEAFAAASPNAKNIDNIRYQLATAYEATGDKEKACLNYKAILNNPQFKEFANHKITVQLKCN